MAVRNGMNSETMGLSDNEISIRIKEAERDLEKNGQYINYRASDILSFADIQKICDHFRGRCHAKINYFRDGRKPYQCFIIQKAPFDMSKVGNMITSEILF